MVRFEAKKISSGCRCSDCFSGDPIVVGKFEDRGVQSTAGECLSIMRLDGKVIKSWTHKSVSTQERETHDIAVLLGAGYEFVDIIEK